MKHLRVVLLCSVLTFFCAIKLKAQTGNSQTIVYPTSYFCSSGTLDAGCGFASYLWSTSESSQVILVAQSDTFVVEVTDSNGFSFIKKFPVVINGPVVETISVSETCDSNGVVSVDSISGVAPFSYLWSTGETSSSIDSLGAGIYTVTITDANGCTVVATDTVTTSMYCSTLPCGLVFDNMNTYTTATAVVGAQGYLVSFYDPNDLTTPVTTHTYPGTNPRTYFNQLSGLFYDQTYVWTVQVVYIDGNGATQTGPESSKNCIITFTKPVGLLPCNLTFDNMNTYRSVLNSTGSSGLYQNKGYEVSFYLPSNLTTPVEVHTYPANNFRTFFNQLSNLHYDQTYIWTVKVKYLHTDGVTVLHGPESSKTCTIRFDKPVGVVPCGLQLNTLLTYTSVLNSIGTAGLYNSQGYLVNFYDPSNLTTPVTSYTYPANNPRTYFNLVPGLSNNQTYIWTVQVQYLDINGILQTGPESSKTCTIEFDPNASPNLNSSSGSRVDLQNSVGDDKISTSSNGSITRREQSLNVYPNPIDNGILQVHVDGVSSDQDISYSIIDASGKVLIEVKDGSLLERIDVSSLPSGMYFVTGDFGGERIQKRVVIR